MGRIVSFTDQETSKIVRDYEGGIAAAKIGKSMNCSEVPIYKVLKANNVKMRRGIDKRTIRMNDRAFAEITPESAYWIGFLMADGCVNERYRLTLSLTESDKSHVEKFRSFICSEHPINIVSNHRGYANCKPLANITLYATRLVTDLARYGVVPRKSHIAEAKLVDKDLNFWRGVVDGDGFISFTKKGCPVMGIVGSRTLMTQFSEFIASTIKCNPPSVRPMHSAWTTRLNGTFATALLRILYSNPKSPSLARKQVIANRAMQYQCERRSDSCAAYFVTPSSSADRSA